MPRDSSALRHPLDDILGTPGAVRVLRALAVHGDGLSASQIAVWTGLPARTVRAVVADLAAVRVLKVSGSQRSRVFALRHEHPLADTLQHLFETERRHWEAILAALADAAERCGSDVVALWIYGSVADGADRPDSDLDIAVVAPSGRADRARAHLADALESMEESLDVSASVVVVDLDEVARLDRDGDPWWRRLIAAARVVAGPDPGTVARRTRREATRPGPSR